jgi:hypothetical protein
MNGSREMVLEKVDLILAQLAELRSRGPHFRIEHRFHRAGTDCAPGEEIFAICLIHHRQEYQLHLSLALRILFDYLAHHSRVAQSAGQIEAGIRANPFYAQHASAIMGRKKLTRCISRSAVKVYVQRLRLAIDKTCRQAGLQMSAHAVLISQQTVMNEVGYRMKAIFKWSHIDL